MSPKLLRICAPLVCLCFLQLACYKNYQISTTELEKLESGNIAERVNVQAESGEQISVRATTPIAVETTDGARHDVTPFNFTLSQRDLVAPDYDLLLSRSDVSGARVGEFSKGRTIGLIVGAVVAAGGAFALVSILAGSDQGFEQ